MNSKAFLLFLALASAPLLALAQTPSPAPATTAPASPMPAGPMRFTPAQMRAHMQAFRGFHEQAERVHKAARARMLAVLTPAHRALLARLVGNLAIATNPDPRATARELDTALSTRERQAVLDAGHSEMQEMHALMERMRSQMQTKGAAIEGHGMMQGGGMMARTHCERHTPDAGFVLLHGVMPGHPPMMMMRSMKLRTEHPQP